MKKAIKVGAWILGGIVGLVFVVLAAVYVVSNQRMSRTYDVDAVALTIPADSASVAYGQHVAEIRGCTDCHRPDLGGRTFIDAMPMARLTASNLTSGQNGVAGGYTDADWVRAIRDGIRPDGRPLLFMPSYEYRAMGPEDLGSLIGWIKSMPPVDTDPVEQQVGPLGRVLYVTGQLPLVAAEMIDHGDRTFTQPEAGVTVEYGGYLATSCLGCHGEGFSGGPIPGVPPDWPEAGNLTPDPETGLGSWTEEDFMSFFEDGTRPDGREVDPQYMPWPIGAAMTQEERQALWTFLRSLPPAPKGNR